jgi:hypothetical protein
MSSRYSSFHKNVRRRWKRRVERGGVDCARCGEPIEPTDLWDLGHVDGGRPGQYAGPEHRRCNRGAPAAAAWRALAESKNSRAQVRAPAQTVDRWPGWPLPDPDPGNRIDRWSLHWHGPANPRCPPVASSTGRVEPRGSTPRDPEALPSVPSKEAGRSVQVELRPTGRVFAAGAGR